MSHRKTKRARCAARTALVTAVSLEFLAIAVPAGAQTTPPAGSSSSDSDNVDEIVVTGFRASLQDALEKKRDSNQIIETITAEDIGKFPDQNVAESLQRLPGVQIDRTNGQGTRVRIRGLEQNVTTLNDDIFVTGLELYTLGEGNQNQTDSLEGIPSELLGGVDVFKSPQANQSEGGLGGIINLRTRNPLSLKGTTIAGNVRISDSPESRDSASPLGAIVFGHQFSDRFGILATVSYDDQTLNTDVLGGANRGNWRFTGRNDRVAVPENYYAPEYRYVTDRDESRERLGASLAVGFKPSDATELTAEYFHSNLDIITSEASLKFPFATEGGRIDTTRPFDIDDNGVLLNGTIVSNSAEAISYVENTEITADNLQLRFGIDNGGAVAWNFTGAWSQADMESTAANNDVRYTQYGVRPSPALPNPTAPANYPFDYNNGDGELPSFGLSANPSLVTTPSNGFFKSHWVFADTSEITNWAASGNATYTPSFIDNGGVVFTAGIKLAEREVDYSRGRYLADYSGRGELNGSNFGRNWSPFGYFQDGAIGFKSCDDSAAGPGGGLPVGTPGRPACPENSRFGGSPALITPYQTFTSTADRVELINDFWSSGTVASNQILVQDRSEMENAVAWIQSLYPTTPFSFFEEPLESFVVTENTTSAYVMADLGQAEDRYHVNVGARIVRTELEVDQNAATAPTAAGTRYWGTDSWNGTTRDFETQTNSRTYTDILPSMNFVISPTEAQKVRFAAARVVSRQPLFDLGRGFQTNFTRNATTNLFEFVNGTRGNPELDPYRASQFDVAYEYYFGSQGLVTGGYFWKEVDSFIVTETQPVFVNDQAGGRLGPVSTPVNGRGGNIKGFELGAQYAFEMGLGFNVNYTFSDSESPTFNDFENNLPIPGVAENSVNAQVYFDKAGFEARLSYSWRDESFAGNFGFPDAVNFTPANPNGTSVTRTLGVWNRDYGQLDAQIGYNFMDGKLGVTLEALNLTNEDASQYLQFTNLPFTFSSGDRRMMLGVRFNFGSN